MHTKYKLTLHQRDISLSLLGDMKKSTQGYNRFWTKLYINNLPHNKLSFLEIKDFRLLYLFKNNYKNPVKSDMLKLIRNHHAKQLRITIDGFEIKFNFLFDNTRDFENAILLAYKLVDYISHRETKFHS